MISLLDLLIGRSNSRVLAVEKQRGRLPNLTGAFTYLLQLDCRLH